MFHIYKYHAIAILTVIIWGTTFISTKILIYNGLTPVTIFFIRFLLAYISIWTISFREIRSKSWKDEFLFAGLGLFGGSLYFITENTALEITQASNVSLIVCTSPILTALLSSLIYKKEKLRKNLIYGSLLALLGVAFVVFNGSFILKLNPLGDFFTGIAALSWAFYGLLLKKMETRYSTLFITRKVFFYGIITLLPLLYFYPIHIEWRQIAEPVVWLNILFLGIIASMLCFIMWNIAVKHLGVVRTTNYIYIVPLVTLITSALILHEKITGIALLGSLFILSGVYIAEKGLTINFIKNKNK